MCYVVCPLCCQKIEVPADVVVTVPALGPFCVVLCDVCDLSFDYAVEQVAEEDEPTG